MKSHENQLPIVVCAQTKSTILKHLLYACYLFVYLELIVGLPADESHEDTKQNRKRKVKVKFKISTAVILEGCFRVEAGLRKLQCFNLAQ